MQIDLLIDLHYLHLQQGVYNMSMKINLQVVGESLGVGDAIEDTFTIDNIPVLAASETVYVDGVAKSDPGDYSLVDSTGVVTFVSPPASGALLTVDYTWNILFEMYPDDVTHESKSKRKIYPIPNAHSIVVPLGEEGPIMRIQSDIDATERAKIVEFPSQNTIKVVTSTYVEFVVDEEYILDSKKVNRKGGYVDKWRVMLVLIRKWT